MISWTRIIAFPILSFLICDRTDAELLSVYFIDVEQADSTLIISPSGRSLLIDSGKNGMGARIKAIMDEAGIAEINHYVTTHYHEDHYGGIDDLVNLGVVIKQAYDRGDKDYLPASKLSQSTYVSYQDVVGKNARHLMRGETIDFDEKVLVTTISSGGVVLGESAPPAHADEENDMSISLLVNFSGIQIFLGGDIERKTEEKIALLDVVKNVDVYKSNHHGSDTSSSVDFMTKVNPSLIVISNGSNRTYEHPRHVTLSTYSNLASSPLVLQTNKYIGGGLNFGNVADEFIADLPPGDTGGTIKLVIDSDSRKITVSYRDMLHTLFARNNASSLSTGLRIESLLPDPVGPDLENEEVTITNSGTSSVNLSDYLLMDESGRVWLIDGDLASGESIVVRRNGMPMSLNNQGDTIYLKKKSGERVDSFHYSVSETGKRLHSAI